MRKFVVRLTVLLVIFVMLMGLPAVQGQALDTHCYNGTDRNNPFPLDATTPEGRQKLYPWDTAWCEYKEVKSAIPFSIDNVEFRPLWEQDVYWSFDRLESTLSKFWIEENGTVYKCYDVNESTPECLNTIAMIGGNFKSKPNARYNLRRQVYWEDTDNVGRVAYWLGDNLDDRNDVCADAQSFQVPGASDGFLEFAGDHDWFLINLTERGVLLITLGDPSDKNYSLELWGNCSTRLDYSETGEGNEIIDRVVEPGSYRIHVFGVTATKDFDKTQHYTLTVKFTATPPPPPPADTTPPVTTAILHNGKLRDGINEDPVQPDPRGKAWYNAGAWLELQRSDAGSGIAGTWWQIDDPACSPPNLTKCQPFDPNLSPGKFDTRTHTIYFFSQDKAGNFETQQTIGPFNVDATIPSCAVEWSKNAQGQTTALKITTQDTDSGGKWVDIPPCDNCQSPGSRITFRDPNTDPLVIQITKSDLAKSMVVVLEITDYAGNTRRCAPADVTVGSGTGETTAATLSAVPQAQSKLKIQNGKPGLTNLRVTVNGKNFEVAGLKEGQSKDLDISSAMRPGNKNTITLTGRGKKGGNASVLLLNGK